MSTQYKDALGAPVVYADITLGDGSRLPKSAPSDATGVPLFSGANPAHVSVDGGTLTAQAGQITVATATIALNASLSGAVDLGLARLAKVNMPAAWDAAALTFQTSADGVTYRDLYDAAGTLVTVQAAASRSIILPLSDWLGTRYVKVRSGTVSTPVNQTAARSLDLVLVP